VLIYSKIKHLCKVDNIVNERKTKNWLVLLVVFATEDILTAALHQHTTRVLMSIPHLGTNVHFQTAKRCL